MFRTLTLLVVNLALNLPFLVSLADAFYASLEYAWQEPEQAGHFLERNPPLRMQRIQGGLRGGCIATKIFPRLLWLTRLIEGGLGGQCEGFQRSGFYRFEDVDWSLGIKVHVRRLRRHTVSGSMQRSLFLRHTSFFSKEPLLSREVILLSCILPLA